MLSSFIRIPFAMGVAAACFTHDVAAADSLYGAAKIDTASVIYRLDTESGDFEVISGVNSPEGRTELYQVSALAGGSKLYTFSGNSLYGAAGEGQELALIDTFSFSKVSRLMADGDQLLIIADEQLIEYDPDTQTETNRGTYSAYSDFDPVTRVIYGINSDKEIELIDLDEVSPTFIGTIESGNEVYNGLSILSFTRNPNGNFYFIRAIPSQVSNPPGFFEYRALYEGVLNTDTFEIDLVSQGFYSPEPASDRDPFFSTSMNDVFLHVTNSQGFKINQLNITTDTRESEPLLTPPINSYRNADGTISVVRTMYTAFDQDSNFFEVIPVSVFDEELNLIDTLRYEISTEPENAQYARGTGPTLPDFYSQVELQLSSDQSKLHWVFRDSQNGDQLSLFTVDIATGNRSVSALDDPQDSSNYPVINAENHILGAKVTLAPDPERGPSPAEFGFHLTGIKQFDENTEDPDRNRDQLIDTGDLQTRKNEMER